MNLENIKKIVAEMTKILMTKFMCVIPSNIKETESTFVVTITFPKQIVKKDLA
jgi:hypothetical protein